MSLLSNLILLGDFNVNFCNSLSPLFSKLQHTIASSLCLTQVVTEPTCLSSTSNSLIDLVFVSASINVLSCTTIPALANSDHHGLCTSIAAGCSKAKPKRRQRKVWRYSHANFERASELLVNTDWDSLFDSGDVNVCWANWKSRFLEVMMECIPQSTLRSRQNLPWLTKSIMQAIRRRNALYNAHKKTKSTSAYQKYRAARNRVTAMLRLSKAKYFRKLQSQKPKDFWKSIKLLNKQESSIPTLNSADGTEVTNARDKATLLNSFFYTCFNNKSPPLLNQPPNLLSQECPPDILCTEDEVYDLVVQLDPSKSTGPDGISVRMLRGTADAIVPSLTRLFNLSLTSGTFPESWKLARIVPVPKATDMTSPSNYRPISILSIVSKLLERHVHQLLFQHLCNYSPISHRQWGFLPGRSTASALLSVTHDWLQQLEQGNEICSVFFDLRKAFDSVPHHLLLQRLIQIDTNPFIVQWIHSYLTCRSQLVVVDGEQSPILPVISGVPQGSVLGPLLFLIFINDVVHQISPRSAMSLFADDIALYRPICSLEDYIILQNDVTATVDWVVNSLLSLQPAKCCYMVISRKRSLRLPPPPILVENTPLLLVNSVKYLGIQINSDLSWCPHVTNLCNKTRRLIGLLYRRFYKHAASSTLLQLYKSFIRPHLEYCSVVWNPYLACDIESLEKVQRFALRVCLKNWTASHEQLYSQSNVPPLSVRRSNASLCHLYKLVNDLIDYPNSPLDFRVIQHNSRHSHVRQLRDIHSRTAQFQHSFFPGTIALWNSLPHNVLSSPSFLSFKSRLNQF